MPGVRGWPRESELALDSSRSRTWCMRTARMNERSFGYRLGKSIGEVLSDELFAKAPRDDQRIDMHCEFSE